MKTEIKYRSFDELLASVQVDFDGFNLDGYTDPQKLIKVAMRVNRHLGLRINPSKQKCLEVCDGKVRLPDDFHVLNFALVAEDRHRQVLTKTDKTYTEQLLEDILSVEMLNSQKRISQYTTVVDLEPGLTVIEHNLNTKDMVVQIITPDGQLLAFDYFTPTDITVSIKSELEETLENVKIVMLGSPRVYENAELTRLVDLQNNPMVKYVRSQMVDTYKRVKPLKITRKSKVIEGCMNFTAQHCEHSGYIDDNFFVTSFKEGMLYINYCSTMEDDDGNLLVLDHEGVNEYYEYALKERILENMILNGEERFGQRYQLVVEKLRQARNNAIRYIRTPDFKEMEEVWWMNRRAMNHRYYSIFV